MLVLAQKPRQPHKLPRHDELYRFLFTRSLNALLTRNAGTIEALILTDLPVRGSCHSRAARFRASKLPNPLMVTFPPRLSSDAMTPVGAKNNSVISFALALVRPSRLAKTETRSRLLTRPPRSTKTGRRISSTG
jgi:hypothetical protein